MLCSYADVESFIRKFEACRLPKSQWTHEAHLVAGYWYARNLDADAALDTIRKRIRAHNEWVGTPNTDSSGYHETITRAYMSRIRAHIDRNREATFEASLALLMASRLSDTGWLLQHYSQAHLFSAAARRTWVEPDIKAF
jgi:hypothetical protein